MMTWKITGDVLPAKFAATDVDGVQAVATSAEP